MTLHDHPPAFVNFYASILGKPDEEKLEHFWHDLYPSNPAFYDLVLARWQKTGESVDQKLLALQT